MKRSFQQHAARKFLTGYGQYTGKFFGRHLGKYTGIKEREGGEIGGTVGSNLATTLGYRKGGRVKKTGKALVHKGEFVLPRGVKPTKAQMKAVKRRK
jgi:hypothetical protein